MLTHTQVWLIRTPCWVTTAFLRPVTFFLAPKSLPRRRLHWTTHSARRTPLLPSSLRTMTGNGFAASRSISVPSSSIQAMSQRASGTPSTLFMGATSPAPSRRPDAHRSLIPFPLSRSPLSRTSYMTDKSTTKRSRRTAGCWSWIQDFVGLIIPLGRTTSKKGCSRRE